MAAEFLGVSPSLVYAYVERKQIPHFRMRGRSIRFRLSELDQWRQRFHRELYSQAKLGMMREALAKLDRHASEGGLLSTGLVT